MSQQPSSELTLGDCSAWVCVNGKRAPVYNIEVEGTTSAKGYIEAVEGAQFTAHFRQGYVAPTTCFKTSFLVDGKSRRSYTSRQTGSHWSSPPDHPSRVLDFKAEATSLSTERPFVFSKLATTDNDDEATVTNPAQLKDLATIRLEARRVTDIRYLSSPPSFQSEGAERVVVSEKAKKAASMQMSLGNERARVPRTIRRTTCTTIDNDAPWRAFEFRYLSRPLLELYGHIPEEEDQLADPVASTSGSTASGSAPKKPAVGDVKPTVNGKRKAREVIVLSDDDIPPVAGSSLSNTAKKVKREPVSKEPIVID